MEAALRLGSHPKPSYFPFSVEILGVKIMGLRTCSIWQHGKGVLPTFHSPLAPKDAFLLLLFLQKKEKNSVSPTLPLSQNPNVCILEGKKTLQWGVQQHPGKWFCVQNLQLFNNRTRKKPKELGQNLRKVNREDNLKICFIFQRKLAYKIVKVGKVL